MSDHPKSTFPREIAFREIFLWRLDEPKVAETSRAFGDALFGLLNEAGQWGPDSQNTNLNLAEVRAALGDLGHVVDYLEAGSHRGGHASPSRAVEIGSA